MRARLLPNEYNGVYQCNRLPSFSSSWPQKKVRREENHGHWDRPHPYPHDRCRNLHQGSFGC